MVDRAGRRVVRAWHRGHQRIVGIGVGVFRRDAVAHERSARSVNADELLTQDAAPGDERRREADIAEVVVARGRRRKALWGAENGAIRHGIQVAVDHSHGQPASRGRIGGHTVHRDDIGRVGRDRDRRGEGLLSASRRQSHRRTQPWPEGFRWHPRGDRYDRPPVRLHLSSTESP